MKSIKLQSDIEIIEVEINEYGDKIKIAAGKANTTTFDKFTSMCKKLIEKSEESARKEADITDKYKEKNDTNAFYDKLQELSSLEREFVENATRCIDEVFGEGTIKKYLRMFYEELEDFSPSTTCIFDFIEQITPVMEEAFDQKSLFDKSKIKKYAPQDHRKKAK